MDISLKEVREYYGRVTGLLSVMNLIFMTVVAAMGIYVADVMSQAGSDDENKVFVLYTVFVMGAVLIILLGIGALMGRRGNYEAALRFRRVLAVLAFAVGILSLMVSASTVSKTYGQWEDAYTAVIFMIQLISSLLSVGFSALLFAFSFKGNKYYDSKQAAEDIPEGMTKDRNHINYNALIGVSYFILSLSLFLLAYYFSREIDYFSRIDLSDNSASSQTFRVIFIVGAITSFIVLVTSILPLFIKGREMLLANKLSYGVNTLVQAAFMAYSLINITRNFVKSKHPDVAYIIFSALFTVINILLALKAVKKEKG